MERPWLWAVVLIVVLLALTPIFQLLANSTVRVRIATTTSLYATGLLDYLAHRFEAEHRGVRIEFIPVGSGAALEAARRGDACAVLVHAPSLESKYLEMGVLEYHHIFAYNFFAIVGPASDPAGVKQARSAVDAFRKIYYAGERGEAVFVSRGDNSGTHNRELLLWKAARLDPHGRPWYRESGTGMGQTLVMADELSAYTLTDTGTFLRYRSEGRLHVIRLLYTNSSELLNIYSAYLVETCKGRERAYAKAFIDFLSSRQDLVAGYGAREYGTPLFYPARGHESWLEKAWRAMASGRLVYKPG